MKTTTFSASLAAKLLFTGALVIGLIASITDAGATSRFTENYAFNNSAVVGANGGFLNSHISGEIADQFYTATGTITSPALNSINTAITNRTNGPLNASVTFTITQLAPGNTFNVGNQVQLFDVVQVAMDAEITSVSDSAIVITVQNVQASLVDITHNAWTM